MRSGGQAPTSHMWGHFLLRGVCVRRPGAYITQREGAGPVTHHSTTCDSPLTT
jgi:hypothetical protein